MRISGIIREQEIRNLDVEGKATYLGRIHQQCAKDFGPGIFHFCTENNGDVSYQYDYAESFAHVATALASKIHPVLTPGQVEAIRHAKSALATLGDVHQQDGEWVSRVDPATDPGIRARLASLNTLEQLVGGIASIEAEGADGEVSATT